MEKFKGFEPIYDINSKVLILGSFPSVKSRAVDFYYGNKQNRFWNMLSKVLNENIPDEIEEKKKILKKHHIALWDVIQESDLKGSSDLELTKSNNTTKDFSFLLPPNTKIEKILCNGKNSFTLFQKLCKTDLPVVCLPSTSPANPRYNYEEWEKQLKNNSQK